MVLVVEILQLKTFIQFIPIYKKLLTQEKLKIHIDI